MRKIAIAILIMSTAFFAIRVIPYVRRPTGGFLASYFAGRMLLTHQDMRLLYDTKRFEEITRTESGLPFGENYTANTPVLPIVLLPFSALPIEDAKMLWELFSLFCLAIALAILYRQFGFDSTERIVITALAFGFTPLYMNFVWGQVYALLLLLHAMILRFWASGKIVAASASIALLLSIKGYGVMFLVLALMRKEWRLLASAGLVFVLIVAVTGLVVGYDTWITYGSQLATFLMAMPASATFQQTIGSCLSWLMVHDQWNSHPLFDLPSIVRPLMALFLVAGIALLYRLSRPAMGAPLDIQFSAAIILGVLTAPLLFDYHYVFLLIPTLVCYNRLSGDLRDIGTAAFALSLLLLVPKIPYFNAVFQNTWLGILGFPRVYGALFLLWILLKIAKGELARRVRPEESPSFSAVVP